MNQQVVVVEDLNFTYEGTSLPILDGINLQVKAGEFITITGPSGCGKSTLALSLAGFIPHSVAGKLEGNIYINGKNTRNYSPAQLAGSVGLVQQDPEAQLCTLKVLDEVAFGPENLNLKVDEIRRRVNWALEVVSCQHLIDREVHSLSGGEKQRVAIAAILAMQPSVLILDEPTANLDPVSMEEVLQVLEHLRHEHNMTVIIIEHRLKRLLSLSDRLVVMDQGKIIADGEPLEVYQHLGFLEFPVAIKDEKDINYKSTPSIIAVENLSFSYGEKEILNKVSFNIKAGEVTALMGNNGSGKTSLLMCLLGINKVANGKLFVKGQEITNHKVSRRARELGLVFQNPNHQIFEHTVLREAHLSSKLLRKEKASRLNTEGILKKFELIKYKDKLPFALSLGEKKRLTLVSVLAYNPAVLILDEPLVGQDEYRINLFWEAVVNHCQEGGTTIMVCHEPDFVEAFCDRILFLQNGNLIIDKPTKEAFLELKSLGFDDYLPTSMR